MANDRELIDRLKLQRLTEANKGRRGHTFTHYPMSGDDQSSRYVPVSLSLPQRCGRRAGGALFREDPAALALLLDGIRQKARGDTRAAPGLQL